MNSSELVESSSFIADLASHIFCPRPPFLSIARQAVEKDLTEQLAVEDAKALAVDDENRRLWCIAEEEAAREREQEKQRLARLYAGGGENGAQGTESEGPAGTVQGESEESGNIMEAAKPEQGAQVPRDEAASGQEEFK